MKGDEMAIRTLKNGKRQVYYRNPFTGRQESRCFDTVEAAEKFDALIKYRLKYERDGFRRDDREEPAPKVDTFETVFLVYLKDKVTNKKALAWQLDCTKTARALWADKPIAEIGKTDLERVKAAEEMKGVKPVTVRSRLKALRTVFRWAFARELIQDVPQFPALPVAHYKQFVPPTEEERNRMLEAAPDHLRRVIVLGAMFGLRVGPCELLRLRWDDVDLLRRVVRVRASRKNLDMPWREVPIRSDLMPIFQHWHDIDAAAGIPWVVSWAGKPVSTIKTAWAATLRRAGITRHIRPYDLRHAFGTEAVGAGQDIGTVANLMGHASPVMLLKHYQHVMTRQKVEAVEALPRVKMPEIRREVIQ